LVIAIINLSDPSALTAGIAAVIPVVFGSVTTWLKIFIDPQKDFRARIDLKKKDLLERVAMDHAVLLNHCRAIDEDTLLRGDGYNEPDLVGNYTRRVFKLFAILHRLETLKLVVKVAYWLLYTFIGFGLVAFLANLVLDEGRAVVFWYGVGAVLLELALVGAVFAASQRLDQYEEIV